MTRFGTNRVTIRRARVTVAACLMTMAGMASGHSAVNDKPVTLLELARRAPLIVQGEVVSVVYRNSEPNDLEPGGVPHTFVTYKVRDTLRGRAGETITLRFVGGADGRGGVYMESTTPTFARGQNDILFIKGGVQDDCPLAACVDGRFRVADGRVYNGWGVPVVEAGKTLVVGGALQADLLTMELPRPPFEALVQRPEMKPVLEAELRGSSMDSLRKRYEREAPERIIVRYVVDPETAAREPGLVGPPIRTFGKAMPLDAFVAAVKAASAQVPASRERPMLANPDARIVIAPPKVAALAATATAVRRTAAEQREYDSLNEATWRRPTASPPGTPVAASTPETPASTGGQQ